MIDKSRKESFLAVGGLCALTATFVFAVYLPTVGKNVQLKKEITGIERNIRNIPERVAEVQMLRQRIDLHERFLAETADVIPIDVNLHSVIQEVAQVASKSRLTVSRLDPQDSRRHAAHQQMSFRMTFRGPPEGISKFLLGIELEKRLFHIRKCTILPIDSQNGLSAQADMDFVVYSRNSGNTDSSEIANSTDSLVADTLK